MAKMLGDLFAVFYYKHFIGVIYDGLLTLRFTELGCTGPVMKIEEDNQNENVHMHGASKAGCACMELLGYYTV
jgi:hypothetical protein